MNHSQDYHDHMDDPGPHEPALSEVAAEAPGSTSFHELNAVQMCDFIARHCIQIIKGGYRWRDDWELRVPAPCGHYREEEERVIARHTNLAMALDAAYQKLEVERAARRRSNTQAQPPKVG